MSDKIAIETVAFFNSSMSVSIIVASLFKAAAGFELLRNDKSWNRLIKIYIC